MVPSRKQRPLFVRWFSNGRYRGSQTPTSDWLESGPTPRPTTADWLEEPSNRPPTDPQKEPPKPRESSWLQQALYIAPGAGLFGAWRYAEQHPGADWSAILEHGALFVASGVLGVALLEFLARRWRAVLATLGIGIGTVGGAFVANPQCLEPIEGGALGEQAVCLEISVGAPPLAPLLPGEYASRATAHPVLWPPQWFEGTAHARASDPSVPIDISSLTLPERDRFHSCTGDLYEDPALKLQAWLMHRWSWSREHAQDIVMDTLLSVCMRHMHEPVEDLQRYFTRSTRYRSVDFYRRDHRDPPPEILPDTSTLLPSEALSRHETEWYASAMKRLTEQEQLLLKRWQRGGSWRTIGDDLGLSERAAANLYHNTLAKLTRWIAADRDRSENPGKVRRGRPVISRDKSRQMQGVPLNDAGYQGAERELPPAPSSTGEEDE